jgi:branched-chain amino acid transport system permease protein
MSLASLASVFRNASDGDRTLLGAALASGPALTPADAPRSIASVSRLALTGLAAVALAALVWVVVERTSLGLSIRAATQDATMAAVLGIDVGRLNIIVFGLGSALAAAAGVILGTMTSLSPQMGAGIVLDAFIAIVIGGLGSFTGAIVGSLLLGQVQSFGVALLPAFHTPLVFLVMAVVLVLRPSGLFGAAERR